MGRPLNRKAIAGLFALGAVIAAWSTQPDTDAGPCVVISGPVPVPDLPEASGLAIGGRTPGIVWSHNDSGHSAVLFALDSAGTVRGRVRVPVRTRDWEDVSAAPCATGMCLYIADIGDNSLARRQLQLLRVPEPLPGDTETAKPEGFSVRYADGRHNAEAAFVIGNHFFVVTRDRRGGLYRADLAPTAGTPVTLERVGELNLEAVSDAERSTDGAWIVVRTSHEVAFYRTAALVRGVLTPAFSVPIDGLQEPQGEGVALDARGASGVLYLASEGSLWNRAGRLLTLRCTLPA
jgi:hypothetical protein